MNELSPDEVLNRLHAALEERKSADPDKSYVASLYKKGNNAILKKIGEEATEAIIAGKEPDDAALVYEIADLWFHSLVLLAARGLSPQAVTAELARREGVSGLTEKASRGQ